MIIMTGASGGLGNYLIQYLSKDNEIIGTYNKHKPAFSDQTVKVYQLDVRNTSSVDNFISQIADELNQIILINLAGISIDGMGHKMKDSTWDQVLETNLKGVFLVSRALLPFMREQEWGRIINVSSIVGQIGIPGTSAYSASKSGLVGLTRTLAVENASKNITVNALALGYFNVGMINVVRPEIQEQIKKMIPMKRFGHPKNVGLAIRFLIESDYITGTVININGGLL